MANDGFNGSTVNFATVTLGSLRGVSVSKTAPEVNVTASGDTAAKVVSGIPKVEVTVDFIGGPPSLGPGSTGALVVNWFDDGVLGDLTNAICLSIDCKGQMDGEISSSAKFAETP